MQGKLEQFESFVNKVKNNVNMNNLGLDNSKFFDVNAKIEDIKNGLESSSDKEKMDSMKRSIAMMSKGRDVSTLFPSVVKNVISKNVELKKLVYMYLVHYAEQEQDSALLAINTFQKDLSNQSQYIRASALKVLSSIRVKIIVQIIIMAIQKGIKDSSAYVRKTAAHAIPKVCSMDPDHKDELVECIKSLLADRATLVLGSAIAAWSEVCPDRIDLIHPHYRKLCHMLADVDEWGQISILNLLTRYSREQFADPNKKKVKEGGEKKVKEKKPKKPNSKWLDSSDDESESDDDEYGQPLDADLRLLLDRALPLLKSRNCGVVMAVSALYYYCAPSAEIPKVIKSLVRISKGTREVEYIVLTNIDSMASNKPHLFEPHLTEFFVRPSDSSFIRNIKLNIISSVASSDNISKILKELKTYVSVEDKQVVAGTIQAIGRCAITVPDVADRCLGGLTAMLTHRSETVVAESVVVIRKLLQAMMANETEETVSTVVEVLTTLSRLVDTVTSPQARASIVWVIGEYSDRVPRLAPDVLRKLAKSFASEDAEVKLQTLNLGAKLQLVNPEQTSKIFEYVLSLARYDASYDVRDRCRVLRHVMSTEVSGPLQSKSQKLVHSKKPVPQQVNPNEGRQRFMLGSLSHVMNHTVQGYDPIPDFPEDIPDPSVRDEQIAPAKQNEPDFWEESESDGSGSEGTESGTEEDDFYSDEEEEEEEESEEESQSEEESDDEPAPPPRRATKTSVAPVKKVIATPTKNSPKTEKKEEKKEGKKKEQSIDDLFSELEGEEELIAKGFKPAGETKEKDVMDDFFGDISVPATTGNNTSFGLFSTSQPRHTLLKSHLGGGLKIEYSYSRSPSMYGATVKTLELFFENAGTKELKNIKLVNAPATNEIIPFADIDGLSPSQTQESTMSLKFTSVTETVKFGISTNQGEFNITLTPSVGDLVRGYSLSRSDYDSAKKRLTGMHEATDSIQLEDTQASLDSLVQNVLTFAYLNTVEADVEGGNFKFSGRTVIEDKDLIVDVTVDPSDGSGDIFVHSEATVLNTLLLKGIKAALKQ
ncbi:hypothetical protein PROFUN_04667 [Planoprotostelium fungivorum]|uniref:AP-3 complex subunit beta n=1 Tax=Planoprotostelium fungivorum TaxID=1890364 RepID=A0A2P6NUP3_9EUKA|nr:hypothetical protein PROFUN_04667 [Planoprotostelium fungivorum]